MRVAFAVLADRDIANFMWKLAFEINAKYRTGLTACQLPPHISLKQTFAVTDVAEVETYFKELANSIEPFEIKLVQVGISNDKRVVWLEVEENPTLRNLHSRVNEELAARFENTTALFDGPDYLFHATIALSKQPFALVEQIDAEFNRNLVNLRFTAQEIAMFYYDDDAFQPGTYMTYQILPLKGIEKEK